VIRPPTLAEWTLCLSVWTLALFGAFKALGMLWRWGSRLTRRLQTRYANNRLTRWTP
jgi:hypothetical protein